MNKLYIKDGVVKPRSRIVVIKDGKQIINPLDEDILADGWTEYVKEPVTVVTRPSVYEQTQTLGRMITRSMADIPETEALAMPDMFDKWEDLIGQEINAGRVIAYGDKLFKVLQMHTAQENWRPGPGTESLFTEISESHAGTLEDPIPYDGNMELEAGKYYSQDGVTYLCNRNTEIPVYNPLADLVGIYVTVEE